MGSKRETRHYIALADVGLMHMLLGPGRPDQFNCGPTEPVLIGETWAYPVSAEIAAEWVSDEDDPEEATMPEPMGNSWSWAPPATPAEA